MPFKVPIAFVAACSVVLGLGCATVEPIHRPPTPAEIDEINASEAPIYVTPIPTTGQVQYAWIVDHLVSADTEKIVVAPEDGAPYAFRLGDVAQFHVRRTGRGAAIGAGVGAGIGAVGGFFAAVLVSGMGYRSVNDPPDTSGFPVVPALALAAVGALFYSAIGALIGTLAGSPEDFPVVLGPAPPSFYDSPTRAPKLALAPPAAQRTAIVVAPSAEVRSAPFKVAPVIAVLPKGKVFLVDPTPYAGWRFVPLRDGRAGYVQDAQVKVDSP